MISEVDNRKLYARDPFAVDPLPRAHYHPSPEKTLSQVEKLINISPVRQSAPVHKQVRNGVTQERDRVSPMDEIFLRGTNSYQQKSAYDQDNHEERLDESWPSTERPSSISLSGLEADSPVDLGRYYAALDRFTDLKKTLSFPDHDSPATSPKKQEKPSAKPNVDNRKHQYRPEGSRPNKSQIPIRDSGRPSDKPRAKQPSLKPAREEPTSVDGSVLQRYVERFRNSAPLSREDRQRQELGSRDFWWLSGTPPTPSDSSTPKDAGNGGKKTRRVTPPLTTANVDRLQEKSGPARVQKSVSIYPPESPGHRRTMELQERADRLLERSSSSAVSTDPAVSTEGLGSNTSDMSSFEEYTFRPKFAQYLDKDVASLRQPAVVPPHSFQRTEEDPLYQWRLRRRMEQAQDSAPKYTPSFDFLSKTDQQKKIEAKLDEFKQKLAGKEPTAQVPQVTSRMTEYHFTPAPPQIGDRVHPSQPDPTQTKPDPLIASPTLHRRRPRTDPAPDVDPHLHLMCDLLPCPHGGQYKQGTSSKGDNLDKIVDANVRRNSSEVAFLKDSAGESGECDTDALTNYKQFLQAEKPDVDQADMPDSHVSNMQNSQVNSNRDSETVERQQRESHKTRDMPEGRPKIKHKTVKLDDVAAERSVSPQTSESDSSQKDKARRDKDTTGQRSRDEDRKHTKGQRSRVERSEARGSGKEEQIPRPAHSSSPKVGGRVDDAIGQVVRENMFNTTSSLVMSSLESLPPTSSSDHPPHRHSQKPPTLEQHIQHDDDTADSDDEFADDVLLGMLRRQRSQYEHQLNELDKVLARMDRS